MTAPQPTPAEVVSRVVWPQVRFLLARWKTLTLAGVLGALLGVGAHLVRNRSYSSGGIYVLATGQQAVPAGGSLGALATTLGFGDLSGGAAFDLNTLAKLARSDRALQRVIDEVDRRARTDSAIASAWHEVARRPDERTPARREALRARFRSMSQVSVDRQSRTFDVEVTAPTPILAHTLALVYAAVLDSLTSEILSSQVRMIRQEAERQAAEAEQDLRAAEVRLQQFLSRNRRFTDPALEFQARALEREATLRASLYSELAARLAEARLEERRGTPALMAISVPRVPVRPGGPAGRALVIVGAFVATAFAAVALIWSRGPSARAR